MKIIPYQKEIVTFLLIIFFVLLNFETNTTKWCGTTLTAEQLKYEQEHAATYYKNLQALTYEKILPISVFITSNKDGQVAVNENTILQAIENLNIAFSPINLRFEACNIMYIQDKNLFTFEKGKQEELLNFSNKNTINLFIVNELILDNITNACGYTFYPLQNTDAIILKGSCCFDNSSSLTHEMGHFLGLYHTHETVFGKENEDGSNCFKSGDLICDTPADPGLGTELVSTNCEYIPRINSFKKFNPDIRNFMAYGRNECRKRFTKDQFNKMSEMYCLFKSHINQLNIKYEQFDSLIVPNQKIKLTVKTKSKTIWPNGDSNLSLFPNIVKDSLIRVKTFLQGQYTIHKNFNIKVVPNSKIIYPEYVCKNDTAQITVLETKIGTKYYLILNNIIQKDFLNGTGSSITFKIPIINNRLNFEIKAVLKNKHSFILTQKGKIKIQNLSNYNPRLKINKKSNFKGECIIENGLKNIEYEILVNNKKISNPIVLDKNGKLSLPFELKNKETISLDLKLKSACETKIIKNAFWFKGQD